MMALNLSVCAYTKVPNFVWPNSLIEGVQSSWVNSCSSFIISSISTVNITFGFSVFNRNNKCNNSINFVIDYSISSVNFPNTTVPLTLNGNETSYLDILYSQYNGSLGFNQPCPVCSSTVIGNFLGVCYSNCTSTPPYIFDNSFAVYTDKQCLQPSSTFFTYATPTTTPTLLPTSGSISIIPNIIIIIILIISQF